MRRFLAVLLASLLTGSAAALDFGGAVEEAAGGKAVADHPEDGYLTEAVTLRGWGQWFLAPGSTLLAKASVTDTIRASQPAGVEVTNTVDVDLSVLSWTTESFQVGRSEYRDFSSGVLAATLDGAKGFLRLTTPWGPMAVQAAVGTSAFQFRSSSTVAVSQDDFLDKTVAMDVSHPATLWASPRLIASVEAALPGRDHDLRLALIGQADLRSGTPKAGDAVSSSADATHPGVSMAYLGLGDGGHLGGPLYWSVSGWVGSGGSLTDVGGTWKASTVVNGLVSADLTVLQPAWNYSAGGLGLKLGSWDPDGGQVQTNAAAGQKPSLYTGWFGISSDSVAQVYNPGYANLAVVKAFWSVKPFSGDRGLLASLQVVTTGLAFVRPTDGPVSGSTVVSGATGRWLGAETDLALLWRPASDWGASLSGGVFLPDRSVIQDTVQARAQLGLTLSF